MKPDLLLQAGKWSIQRPWRHMINHPNYVEKKAEIFKVDHFVTRGIGGKLKIEAEWIWKPYLRFIRCPNFGLRLHRVVG